MARHLKPKDLDAIVAAIELGATLENAAAATRCSSRTIRNWMAKDEVFRERVEEAQRIPTASVEHSLFRIATRERRIVPRCELDHGKGVGHGHAICHLCSAEIVIEVPDADFRAIEFWLTNRERQEWRKRWDLTIENAVPHASVLKFAEVLGGAIREHVLDPNVKQALLDAFEAASASLVPLRPSGEVPQIH